MALVCVDCGGVCGGRGTPQQQQLASLCVLSDWMGWGGWRAALAALLPAGALWPGTRCSSCSLTVAPEAACKGPPPTHLLTHICAQPLTSHTPSPSPPRPFPCPACAFSHAPPPFPRAPLAPRPWPDLALGVAYRSDVKWNFVSGSSAAPRTHMPVLPAVSPHHCTLLTACHLETCRLGLHPLNCSTANPHNMKCSSAAVGCRLPYPLCGSTSPLATSMHAFASCGRLQAGCKHHTMKAPHPHAMSCPHPRLQA